jgi:hypothetical protein
VSYAPKKSFLHHHISARLENKSTKKDATSNEQKQYESLFQFSETKMYQKGVGRRWRVFRKATGDI